MNFLVLFVGLLASLWKASLWTLLFLAPIGVAYYFHLKHRSKYFQRLGLPHPPPTSLLLGNLEEFEKDGKNHEKLMEWHQKYGPTYGMLQGGDRVIVTSDLEFLQDVFVKQFQTFQAHQLHPSFAVDTKNGKRPNVFSAQGQQWKRLRALFASSLTIQKIKSVDPIISKASQELVKAFKAKENGVVDVVPKLLDYTFAVISRSAMGINHKFGENHYLESLLGILNRPETSKHAIASFFAANADFLPITKHLNLILGVFTSSRYFNELFVKMNQAITKRENETPEEKTKRGSDFMDYLYEALQEDLDTTNSSTMDIRVIKKLSREELIGQATAFLIGGADTTASLLTYCLYELARHPEYEKVLIQEIQDYIKSEDDIVYNTIKDLDFLDRFIKETSRLHPFAFTATTRRALETTTVRDSKGQTLKVEKNVVIQANPFAIGLDEKIWGSNYQKFDPDRFLPGNTQNLHPFATFLFGGGLRICPGKNLAIHETKMTLIHLLREFKFEFCDETTTNEVTTIFTNFDNLKMKVLPRNA